MELTGKYELSYTLNRVLTHMVVEVELRENDNFRLPGQNLWSGHATLDGQPYEDEELSHCVNAQYAAESIGLKLKNERKLKAKAEGDSFRIKKEI